MRVFVCEKCEWEIVSVELAGSKHGKNERLLCDCCRCGHHWIEAPSDELKVVGAKDD